MTWPAEYGGAGLGPLQQVVVNQEIGRAGVPGIFDIIGVGMLGPTLIAHGSEEQKQRHLGPMLTADEVWCQLFSEPAAGSDLAGVQTRAKQQEDGSWRLSGQKVWTTNAQHAAFGLLLARTNPDVPKHKGLTMFIEPQSQLIRNRARYFSRVFSSSLSATSSFSRIVSSSTSTSISVPRKQRYASSSVQTIGSP